MYFRLTEEEAYSTSKRLAYKLEDQKKLYEALTKLKTGSFFLKGPHYIGDSKNIRECLRIVQVKERNEENVAEVKPEYQVEKRGMRKGWYKDYFAERKDAL